MATELGQAYVQIMPSAKGISGQIEKELSGGASVAGNKAGGGIASAIKKAIVAAGIGKFISSAINAGGELQQNLGGTEAVFGDFAKNIQASASEAYKNMGMSASDYMATANKMGSLFQGSGLDQQTAMDMTSDAMQRAADVASVMGVDTAMAMESIAGAAKGNFTMMDNLGVAMNATSLQAYALEKGINFEWNTASQAEKSELAMEMFMDRTSQYAGNFARESSETFSGSLGAMKGAWENVLGQMATGQDATEAMGTLGKSVVTFAKNLMPMVTSVLTQLPTLIVTLLKDAGPQLMETGAKAISDLCDGLAKSLPILMPMAVAAIMTIAGTLIDNLPTIVNAAIELVSGLAKGLLDSIPIILAEIPVLLDSIVATLMDLMPLIIDAGVSLFVSLIQAMPQIITTIVAALPHIIDSVVGVLTSNMPLIMDAGVALLTAIVTNLPAIIVAVVGAIPQIIAAMIGALSEGIAAFVDMGAQLLDGLALGIGDAVGNVIAKAKEVAQNIVSSVKGFFGIRSPSTVFAGIGGNLAAGLAGGISDKAGLVSDAMGGINKDLYAAANVDLSGAGTSAIRHEHSGIVRVEGVSNNGELIGTYDIIIDQLSREVRM